MRHWLFSCQNLAIFCLWLAAIAGALAVEKTVLQDIVLRNWDLDDGLPSARINSIVRTSDGYLWLATQKGVARFDGTHFVVFDTSNTPGMKDDRASCLLLDKEGALWAGTYGGTVLKRMGSGFVAQDLGATPPTRKVNALAKDSQGALWLAIEDTGTLRLKDGQVESFRIPSGLASDNVRSLLCDSGGRLWAVAEGKLRVFEEGRWQEPIGGSPPSQLVRTISQARDGGLWMIATAGLSGSHDSRVYKLKDGRRSAQFEPYPWPEDSQQFERLALLEEESGKIWCATAGGLFSRTPDGVWQPLASVAPWVQLEVLCLAEDENGLLWMGTRTTGLLQVKKRQVMTYSLPAFASRHAVLTVCASHDGSVWCGTDGVGIFRWDAGRMTHFSSEHGLANPNVPAVLEDSRTNFWAGTVSGLFRWTGDRFKPALGPSEFREPVRALFEDRRGNLWVGGYAKLVCFTTNGWRVYGVNDGLPVTDIRALAEDAQNQIWVGTALGGIYRQEGDRFRYLEVPPVPQLQVICSLHADSSGDMWVGTDLAGLLRFREGRFDHWLWPADGLPSNHLSAFLEDDKGNLWIGSENGIFGCSKLALDRYERGTTARLHPRRLTLAEGMAHKVCSGVGQPAACKSADGRFWFPNGSALAVFSPASIPRRVKIWPPLIEGASVDGVVAALPPGGLRVRSGARRIDFQYTSPNVLAPEQLRFRFRLDGLDKEWVEAGYRREASYSQLAPGRYEFKVMASGLDDVWREGEGGVRLEVVPRLWERRSIQSAAGLALLVGVAGLVWATERSRSRRRLERLELQRTLDAERQRIARDIHDDLGSGLTEIILLSDSLEEVTLPTPADQKMVGEISARARSLTRAMDEVVWAINPRNDTLEGFLTYLDKFAQDYLTKAGLRCRWNVPLELPELVLSAEMRHSLYLACKEALHNIVKHARASEVTVLLELSDDGFTLTIEDNGQGFAAMVPPGRGNGLSNMRQRASELNGRCRVESVPGSGTRVVFSISVANDPTARGAETQAISKG